MKRIKPIIALVVLSTFVASVIPTQSYADLTTPSQSTSLQSANSNASSNPAYQGTQQRLQANNSFFDIFFKTMDPAKATQLEDYVSSYDSFQRMGKWKLTPTETNFILYRDFNNVQDGEAIALIFSIDDVLNKKYLGSIYKGVSVHALDFQLLSKGIEKIYDGPVDAIRLMSEVRITNISEDGTISYILGEHAGKVKRDADGVVQSSLDLSPVVQNYLDTLNSAMPDYSFRLLLNSKDYAYTLQMSRNEEDVESGQLLESTIYLDGSLNSHVADISFKDIDLSSSNYIPFLISGASQIDLIQGRQIATLDDMRVRQLTMHDGFMAAQIDLGEDTWNLSETPEGQVLVQKRVETLAAEKPLVIETPKAPEVETRHVLAANLTPQQAVTELMAGEYFTQAEYQDFLDNLDFERVYEHLTADEFLNILVKTNVAATSITDAASLKQALLNKGIDIDALRLKGDGILQALANPVGGTLLNYALNDTLAVLKARAAVQTVYESNKAAFMDYFSINNFLELLGAKNFQNTTYDPVYGIFKHIANTTLNTTAFTDVVKAYSIAENIPYSAQSQQALLQYLQDPAEIALAVKRLNSMPEGARVAYIGGGLIYSIFGPDGQLLKSYDEQGSVSATQFDILRDANGNPILDANGHAYQGPWMDTWLTQVRERIDTVMRALKAAGAQIDYLMIDYEEKGSSNYELNSEDSGFWRALMQDARWPSLREQLGVTDQDILNNLDKNGNLRGTSKIYNLVGQMWNIVQERNRVEYFYKGIVAPTQTYFSNVLVGSFEDGFRVDTQATQVNHYRFTNTWGGLGGFDAAGISGLRPSENMTGFSKISTPNGIIQPEELDSFSQLLGMTMVNRANAKVSDMQSLHWLKGPDFQDYINNPNSVLPYYAEMVFHLALNGADQIYIQSSDWSTKAGTIYTDEIFQELNDPNLFAYANRKPIVLDDITLGDKFLVSGMSANGKEIYRVSWESGSLASVLINDGTNGEPLQFKSGDSVVTIPGGRIYIPEGGEITTFLPNGTMSNVSTTGAWVIVDDPSAGKLLNQGVSAYLE